MCELRKEIANIIRDHVRLEQKDAPAGAGRPAAQTICLVLTDPETGEKAVLGAPVTVPRGAEP